MIRNVLIDANNLFHRAQAIFVDLKDRPQLRNSNGYPTGLIYGSLSMLSNFLSDIANPTRILLFLDGVPSRKRLVCPDYKKKPDGQVFSGHIEMPINLLDGFQATTPIDVIVHILNLLGIVSYYSPTEEADDLISSFVHQNPGQIHIILSSDKDFYQIVSDSVVLYRPGTKGNRFYDSERAVEHMRELYNVLVPAHGIRIFKSFTGDPSDGIVGVPRLRKKVIAPLCTLPDVDAVYATGLPGFSRAEKDNSLFFIDRIQMNYALTGLMPDIQLDPLKQQLVPDFDVAFKILQDDFQIFGVDKHSFRVSNQSNIRTSPAIQLDIPGIVQGDFFDDI